MRRRWLTAAVISLSTLVATEVVAQEEGPTAEAQVGTAVVDRTLQGAAESFPASVGTLYCYSKIGKTHAGATIEHVWYHNDVEVARKQLNIGGSPWRTWSSKVIPPDATGDWKVDIVSDGNVISSVAFTVQ